VVKLALFPLLLGRLGCVIFGRVRRAPTTKSPTRSRSTLLPPLQVSTVRYTAPTSHNRLGRGRLCRAGRRRGGWGLFHRHSSNDRWAYHAHRAGPTPRRLGLTFVRGGCPSRPLGGPGSSAGWCGACFAIHTHRAGLQLGRPRGSDRQGSRSRGFGVMHKLQLPRWVPRHHHRLGLSGRRANPHEARHVPPVGPVEAGRWATRLGLRETRARLSRNVGLLADSTQRGERDDQKRRVIGVRLGSRFFAGTVYLWVFPAPTREHQPRFPGELSPPMARRTTLPAGPETHVGKRKPLGGTTGRVARPEPRAPSTDRAIGARLSPCSTTVELNW